MPKLASSQFGNAKFIPHINERDEFRIPDKEKGDSFKSPFSRNSAGIHFCFNAPDYLRSRSFQLQPVGAPLFPVFLHPDD